MGGKRAWGKEERLSSIEQILGSYRKLQTRSQPLAGEARSSSENIPEGVSQLNKVSRNLPKGCLLVHQHILQGLSLATNRNVGTKLRGAEMNLSAMTAMTQGMFCP